MNNWLAGTAVGQKLVCRRFCDSAIVYREVGDKLYRVSFGTGSSNVNIGGREWKTIVVVNVDGIAQFRFAGVTEASAERLREMKGKTVTVAGTVARSRINDFHFVWWVMLTDVTIDGVRP